MAVLLNVFLSQHAYLLLILPKSAHVRRQENSRGTRQVKTIVGASRQFSCSLAVVLSNLLQRFVAMAILFNPTRWFLIAALVGHGATRTYFFRIAPKHYLAGRAIFIVSFNLGFFKKPYASFPAQTSTLAYESHI